VNNSAYSLRILFFKRVKHFAAEAFAECTLLSQMGNLLFSTFSTFISFLRTDKLEKVAECPKKLSDWRTDEKMADTLSLTAELQFPQERRVRNFCSLVQLPMLIHIK
jgi:hypothetical protein